eukprot:TRINITY_DN95117_c0_g1_i1.p1 TRINITY_DN95117_c0_g1~~TRINITY_DN95117_c0_g1_i1.p1  ORF type:complete len:409 (+),score=77.28 TRINITY_DN95117_c0_g1_i1:22-1227(+)
MPPKKKQRGTVKWEWQDDTKWVTFADEDCLTLEKAYNGVASRSKMFSTTELSFNTGFDTQYDFNFRAWTQTNTTSGKQRKIRRIAEQPSDDDEEEEESEKPTKASEPDRFEWQWKDDSDMWVAYYDEDNTLVEKAYRTAPTATFTTTSLSFNAEHRTPYIFDFVKQTQYNTESKKVRQIRRVKKDVKGWSLEGYGITSTPTPPPVAAAGFPEFWDARKGAVDLVTVGNDSAEWADVLAPFLKTINRKVKIVSLIRIQNYTLWQFYALTRAHIAKRNGGNPKEATLFHGARLRANMDAITQFGFDMRVAAQGSVGSGIYFAVNAQYSDRGYVLQNTDKSKEMFICKVALGSGVQGNPTLRRPPPKDPKQPAGDLHDSVFNGAIMHVVFNNAQAYPAYVVKYK